ncbi:unnamed protein product [Amoebophrya sp. A120]|nr:unnamed protein product [Amoebophrya sp. A120]|eukprot:GSA120T00000876001.1
MFVPKSHPVAVFGSCGSLGRATVTELRRRGFPHLLGIDVGSENAECTANLQLSSSAAADGQVSSLRLQQSSVLDAVAKVVAERAAQSSAASAATPSSSSTATTPQLSAVLCLAGGWAGGNAASEDLLPNAEAMIASSLYASLISVSVAARFNTPLVVLPGAAPVLGAQACPPFMLPYAVAKAGVHQLLASASSDLATAGLPVETKLMGIAPRTLDTTVNRQNMPDADFSCWTPLPELARQLANWVEEPSKVVAGKMYEVVTESGKTEYR